MGGVGPEAILPPVDLAADLYLSCACAAGSVEGLAAFEQRFAEPIARAVARVDASPAFIDDACQVVWQHLFVAPEGATPKICEYAGRAPLRAWLRAVAVRSALNLRRRKDDQSHDTLDGDSPVLGAGLDPETAYMKARYKVEFEAAVHTAVMKLSPEERTLLRLHLADGLSIDVLSAHYRISRSSVARRVASAREALRTHTRAALMARLKLSEAEIASLAALVRSQIDVSAASLFRTRGE